MLLKSILIQGLLSFRDVELEMRPLNVLIGPNASGKSNLIEIMALLQAVPRDLAGFFRRNGGISDWLYKGERTGAATGAIAAEVIFGGASSPLAYALIMQEHGQHLEVAKEGLENLDGLGYKLNGQSYTFLVEGGQGFVIPNQEFSNDTPSAEAAGQPEIQQIDVLKLTPGQSVLQQIKDPFQYPEMHFLSSQFDAIRLYRDWNMGRNSAIRRPQPTDALTDFLYEDFANLSLMLNRLERSPAMQDIEEQLKQFYETYERVGVDIYANTAQLWIREKGLSNPVPATRLSDGTLRFLALLSILCHPEPPPLICIEEPELGLHPDIIHQLAKLLLAASRRTQLIITTHSADLVDHLWEDPESVVICERYPETGTELNRLKKEELKSWLERYELGELWRHGHIGGTRY